MSPSGSRRAGTVSGLNLGKELGRPMSIAVERKQEILTSFRRNENDTGSPEVQIALLTERIQQVQDFLGRRILIENVSSYLSFLASDMEEADFIAELVRQADCELLLDVNNIFVNSVNFKYDPHEYLAALDLDRTAYIHVAGHYVEAPDLRVDTHGADVIDPVWDLLEVAYDKFGVFPTLLERDFNIPPLPHLLREVETIANLQKKRSPPIHERVAHG